MFTCEKCEKILARYVVGALPPWSRSAVVKHLDGCSPCQKALDSHYRVALLLEACPPDDPPSSLWNRVANEIADESPGHERIPHATRDWRPGLIVAAAGLTAGVFLGQAFNLQGGASSPTLVNIPNHSPSIATFVQQHSRMSADNPLADQVTLAAYETAAFRDNERMEGQTGSAR